jgi:sialate O-acetylesterase
MIQRPQRPATGRDGQWQVCTPASLDESRFSAVGYFFAREVHREVKVPVGMIQASVGGTRIEAWTAPAGFELVPSLRPWANAAATSAQHEGVIPSSLYRAMVAPLAPYAMRGALWYQGEANCWLYEGATYTDKMRALIGGWRDAWGGRPFPFYFVQLAPYRYSARPKLKSPADALPRIRDAQTRALVIPNTAMVVTTDLVDDVTDIHPVRKREVGERLAACALARDYGKADRPYRGPTYKKITPDGEKLVVTFVHADGGLKSRDGKPLSHFAVAGDDGDFVPADATISGSDSVTVSSARVAAPKFVRFGWSETATPNLCNGAGLPAVPFRTDDFSAAAASRPVGGAAVAVPE